MCLVLSYTMPESIANIKRENNQLKSQVIQYIRLASSS